MENMRGVSTVSVQILDLLIWFVKHSEGQLIVFVPKQFHIQKGEEFLFFDRHPFMSESFLIMIPQAHSELEAIIICYPIYFQLKVVKPTYNF
jgi:hypothetical protein